MTADDLIQNTFNEPNNDSWQDFVITHQSLQIETTFLLMHSRALWSTQDEEKYNSSNNMIENRERKMIWIVLHKNSICPNLVLLHSHKMPMEIYDIFSLILSKSILWS